MAVSAPPSPPIPTPTATPLYRAVWRWHLIAGLLVSPLLAVLAVTGFVYLFQVELESLVRPAWHAPSSPAGTRPAAEQVAAAVATVPGGTATGLLLRRDPVRPTVVSVSGDAGTSTVFVDPATATVVGATADRFTDLAIRIHRDLLLGTPGRYLLELAGCWGLVLIGTGLVLWFPRGVERLRGVLVPRLAEAGRTRWRDLHAVPAALTAGFAAFLILSGLPWTVFWGDQYDRLARAAGAGYPVEVFFPCHSTAADGGPDIGLDRAIAVAGPMPGDLQIDPPSGPRGSYHLRQPMGAAPEGMRHVFIDRFSGAILLERGFADVGALARPVSYGVSLHMGRYFGALNQWLCALGCLGVLWMTVTGAWLWWTRRPTGGLGVPAPVPWRGLPRWTRVLVVVVALALPVLGLSVLVAWAVDRLVLARWRRAAAGSDGPAR